MSVSSVGSSNPNAYLQRLLQPDDADPADAAAPSDPLQALFQAITGGKSSDPLISAATSGDGSAASSGAPQFSPDVMKALLSVQGNQAGAGASKLESLLGKFDTNGDGQISQSEFETAIGPDADKAKVDELFKKLDGNGDGAVSQDELKAAVQKAPAAITIITAPKAPAVRAAAIRCRRCCRAPPPTAPPASPPPTPTARRPRPSLTPTAPRSR